MLTMVYIISCLSSGLPVLCPTLRAWRLSPTGYVAALEPTPGRSGRQWLGSLPRHSAGVGIPHSHCQVTRPTAILALLIPSPPSHGSALARTGRKSLIHTKPKKTMVFHQRSAFRGFPPGPCGLSTLIRVDVRCCD